MPHHRPNQRDRLGDRPKDFDGTEAARLLYGGTPDADDSDGDREDDSDDDPQQAEMFD